MTCGFVLFESNKPNRTPFREIFFVAFEKLKSKLVGVNNRNLKTMEVDINNAIKLKKFIDPNKIVVAESGLKTHSDLLLFKENGIINFLIGESLMKEKYLTLATKKILGIKNWAKTNSHILIKMEIR